MIRAAYEQFRSEVPHGLFAAYVDDLTDLDGRSAQGAEILAADVGGDIAGTVTYYPDAGAQGFGWPAGWAGFRALAVDPSHRGAGIGRALLAECMARAAANGAPAICLHTAAIMAAAVRIYETTGFVRVPEFDITPQDVLGSEHDGGPPVVAYRLDLAARTR